MRTDWQKSTKQTKDTETLQFPCPIVFLKKLELPSFEMLPKKIPQLATSNFYETPVIHVERGRVTFQ